MNTFVKKAQHKPVVTYTDASLAGIGIPAFVQGIKNHPRLGNRTSNQTVKTSPVVHIYDAGVFETQNTKYVPENFSPQASS